jgi:hypothetical protein
MGNIQMWVAQEEGRANKSSQQGQHQMGDFARIKSLAMLECSSSSYVVGITSKSLLS